MLTHDGTLREGLMDFGLAKGQSFALTASRADGVLGTPRYPAPEQLAAATLKVCPTADVRPKEARQRNRAEALVDRLGAVFGEVNPRNAKTKGEDLAQRLRQGLEICCMMQQRPRVELCRMRHL